MENNTINSDASLFLDTSLDISSEDSKQLKRYYILMTAKEKKNAEENINNILANIKANKFNIKWNCWSYGGGATYDFCRFDIYEGDNLIGVFDDEGDTCSLSLYTANGILGTQYLNVDVENINGNYEEIICNAIKRDDKEMLYKNETILIPCGFMCDIDRKFFFEHYDCIVPKII